MLSGRVASKLIPSLWCWLLLLQLMNPSRATPAAAQDLDGFGSLPLCPPGGRSFMMAWSLACEMRRRKRSAQEHSIQIRKSSFRPATLTEIQKICCEVGCEIRDLLSYCDPFGPWNS